MDHRIKYLEVPVDFVSIVSMMILYSFVSFDLDVSNYFDSVDEGYEQRRFDDGTSLESSSVSHLERSLTFYFFLYFD